MAKTVPRVRKRCLACGRVALYQRGVTACERRFGFGRLGHQCRGPLQAVPRREPTWRQQTPQETAARLAVRFRAKVERLTKKLADDAAALRAAWNLLERYEARSRMTAEEAEAEREKGRAAAAKALETRRGRRRKLALDGGV